MFVNFRGKRLYDFGFNFVLMFYGLKIKGKESFREKNCLVNKQLSHKTCI